MDVEDYSLRLSPSIGRYWFKLIIGEAETAASPVDVCMLRPDVKPLALANNAGEAMAHRISAPGLRVEKLTALPAGWGGRHSALTASIETMCRISTTSGTAAGTALSWIDVPLPSRNNPADEGVKDSSARKRVGDV